MSLLLALWILVLLNHFLISNSFCSIFNIYDSAILESILI